ncbi:FAD binding domain-containing protein [Hirsutella rhossiliensis]|uniref:FAD binding domain-containing protein n=1 Tax=Hirsutella rhossiliensis TaxID=111463 RepID=A0A9P8MRG5_9HYPO|nr:FAD binding domain-containing protein [Hirsutella rhossiliensis]KAH0959129.1 FAD binding domain-containing protein [Hirsutella rhossiliensis]
MESWLTSSTRDFVLEGTCEEASKKEVFDQFNTNVFGAIKVAHAVISYLRAQPCSVIANFGSIASWGGFPAASFYNSSKWAISGFTESIPVELAAFKINCTVMVDVPFLAPNSVEWTREISSYNIRLNCTPAAVAVPQSINQIQAAVSCGIKNHVRVSAKGGGHSFGSFGLGGEDGHLVIELCHMRQITLKDDNTAKIQPGARLLDVATELYSQGRRAISHGSCLGVGIAGHVLHGGFGFASRTHGLALDWLIGATVILADGSVLHCSATENKDLFWALRGAGSSFGIVAEFEFETFAAPDKVTPFDVELSWDQASAVAVIGALQRFAASAPKELNLMLDITPTTKTISGVYYGDQTDANEALRPLLDGVAGNFSAARTIGWIEALMHFDDLPPLDPHEPHDTFYATSFMTSALTVGQAQSLAAALFTNTSNLSAHDSLYLSVEAHGGNNSAVADVSPSATAYVHRDKLLLFQLFDGGVGGHYPEEGFSLLGAIRESVTGSMAEGRWGMYANYIDTEQDAETAARLYWGNNVPRLQRIKAELDPRQVFWNPQGIQPIGHSFTLQPMRHDYKWSA